MITGVRPCNGRTGPICEPKRLIPLVCTDATGENFAFAPKNEGFIRSNSWTASVDPNRSHEYWNLFNRLYRRDPFPGFACLASMQNQIFFWLTGGVVDHKKLRIINVRKGRDVGST
jgi:hypothetical protein